MPHTPTRITDPVIDVQGLVKRYKDFVAVDGISLQVHPGEIFGILGPNGAGKTTTLEMIEGLREPDGGTITVAGHDAIRDTEAIRKIIGVQLQTTSLFQYLNARELVELFADLYEVPNGKQRAQDLLAKVNLESKARNRVEELSGGQQQRLSIALALINSPVVTFLDEPTTGLDPHARRQLWQTILDIRAAGSTVVLTTHYMDEAEALCDRIAIMDSGRVIACDTPQNLIRGLPQDAVVMAVLKPNGPTLTEPELTQMDGATHVALSTDAGQQTVKISSKDVQATLVGMLRLAEQRGITYTELTSTRADLEDVFLALTGRAYANEDDADSAAQESEPAPTSRSRRFRR